MTIAVAKKEVSKKLSSNNAVVRVHGLAYSEIATSAAKDATPRLSEEVLLDEHARIKMVEYRKNFDLTGEQTWAHKARACGDFLLKSLSQSETEELVKNLPSGTSFDEAKELLASHPLYKKLSPETLASALSTL